MAATLRAPQEPRARISAKQGWALATLVLPVLLISIDMTVLGFAVPFLSEDLAPTSSQLLWIVDVYGFVLAGLLVTLGDRVGRRKLLVIGSAAFAVASVLAAYAPSAEALIAARALLGLAGATLMPTTLALMRNLFHDDRQRKFAIAIWASGFSAGAALGPILGGWLLEHFWWGSVFLMAAPVSLAVVLAAPFPCRSPRTRTRAGSTCRAWRSRSWRCSRSCTGSRRSPSTGSHWRRWPPSPPARSRACGSCGASSAWSTRSSTCACSGCGASAPRWPRTSRSSFR
jgi:MFS family permease